jgi:hypothetical protein
MASAKKHGQAAIKILDRGDVATSVWIAAIIFYNCV